MTYVCDRRHTLELGVVRTAGAGQIPMACAKRKAARTVTESPKTTEQATDMRTLAGRDHDVDGEIQDIDPSDDALPHGPLTSVS